MTNETTIDILLATYNGEKYVKEQIESILNQTYKNIRLVISDDASSDNTREILKEYEKDPRIEIHYQDVNQGYVKNFEYLLKQVKNQYFMISDQDDFWLPEKAEKSLEKLKKENVDLVFGDLEIVNQNLETIYPSFNDFMLLSRKINKYINTGKMNYLYNCITGCTILAKKETINVILPIPKDSKRLIHDHWIGRIVELNGKLAYMPEKYIKYRQHENNQVGTNKISHGFSKLSQVRELFIDVKLGIFKTYVNNNERFSKDVQNKNIKALEYYEMINKKKNINFKKWNIFHELYKTETLMYYIENFMILNMPILINPIFKIRYGFLKMLGKR